MPVFIDAINPAAFSDFNALQGKILGNELNSRNLGLRSQALSLSAQEADTDTRLDFGNALAQARGDLGLAQSFSQNPFGRLSLANADLSFERARIANEANQESLNLFRSLSRVNEARDQANNPSTGRSTSSTRRARGSTAGVRSVDSRAVQSLIPEIFL